MSDDRTRDPLDRLLAGGSDAADAPAEQALVDTLRRLRGETDQAPPTEVAEEQLSAIVALAQEHAHSAPVATPASAAPLAGWRRRLGLAGGLSLGKVVLVAGVAAAATGGGLAATGSLPAPAQQAIADAGDRLGIPIPPPRLEVVEPTEAPADDHGQAELAPPVDTPPSSGTLPTPTPHRAPEVVPPVSEAPGPPPSVDPPERRPVDPPTPSEVPPSERGERHGGDDGTDDEPGRSEGPTDSSPSPSPPSHGPGDPSPSPHPRIPRGAD